MTPKLNRYVMNLEPSLLAFFLLGLSVLASCTAPSPDSDVGIAQVFPADSVCVLFFEEGFDNCNVFVWLGDSLIFREAITTDPSTGLAESVYVYHTSKNPWIRINVNGQIAEMLTGGKRKYSGVRIASGNLEVEDYPKPRVYQ